MKARIIIAGGSGFVGQALSKHLLANNYDVVVLTRHPSPDAGGVTDVLWDGQNLGNWAKTVDGAEAVVNLTGKSVNCRHTPENKREILESRVNATRVLGHAVESATTPPRAFVQASGVGIYQDRGALWADESSPHGTDFMAQVCDQWEGAFNAINAPNTRKVLLRFGVVLGRDGGFLKVLGGLTKWFLGGQAGNGRQFISWIHMNDLLRMITWGIEKPSVSGIFNATAPNPTRNKDVMQEMRQVLRRPWSPPVPEFALRMGAPLMGTDATLALASQRATPKHFLDLQFPFDFPELRPALENIYRNPNK